MTSKYDYDIIRDYLHGLTDQETAKRIHELIRTDEVARNIATGILQLEHDFDGDETQIENYIESLHQKQLDLINRKNNVRVFSGSWIAIAAAVLIVAVIGSVVVLSGESMLDKELSEPYPYSAERGSDVNDGFRFYQNRDYRNAISRLNDDDATAVFYKGLSYLYVGEYQNAITSFSSLETSRYNEQARWFTALALLKSGKITEGKIVLNAIVSNNGYKSSEARELLSSYEE